MDRVNVISLSIFPVIAPYRLVFGVHFWVQTLPINFQLLKTALSAQNFQFEIFSSLLYKFMNLPSDLYLFTILIPLWQDNSEKKQYRRTENQKGDPWMKKHFFSKMFSNIFQT